MYRHEENGFGQKGSKETFLTTKDDKYFRPDDICAAPDGSLFVSDWYDGGVGGHAYNDPDRGRIYRITPTGKKVATPTKPGPYATLDDAAVALRSVNLDTQFQAREKFLAEGAKSLPTLTKLLADADPNLRARALWLCDRIGGDGVAVVRKQLSSDDEKFRALAVRILGRHGESEFANISASCNDPAKMVRREALLALRNLTDPKVVPLLTKAALAYDGEDRYELETLNIAAGSHKSELAKALLDAGKVTPKLFALVQLLDPKTAGDLLAKQLADPKTDVKSALEMIDALGRVTDVAAGRTLIHLAVSDQSKPAVLRAMSVVGNNLGGAWQTISDDKGLHETAKRMLKDGSPELREAALGLTLNGQWRDASAEVAALCKTPGNRSRCASRRSKRPSRCAATP
ncbi:MAG: HEAT repeat domain-containing protein [Pirellulales bacterium]